MAVVRLRGPLRRLAGDQAEHAIEGDSVAALLHELEREHPATSGWILDERGAVRAVRGHRAGAAILRGREIDLARAARDGAALYRA